MVRLFAFCEKLGRGNPGVTDTRKGRQVEFSRGLQQRDRCDNSAYFVGFPLKFYAKRGSAKFPFVFQGSSLTFQQRLPVKRVRAPHEEQRDASEIADGPA